MVVRAQGMLQWSFTHNACYKATHKVKYKREKPTQRYPKIGKNAQAKLQTSTHTK